MLSLTVWQVRRLSVLNRDGFRCVICGRRKKLTVHHIRPRCIGGSDDFSNLVTLCRRCHDELENDLQRFFSRLAAGVVWCRFYVLQFCTVWCKFVRNGDFFGSRLKGWYLYERQQGRGHTAHNAFASRRDYPPDY